MSEADMYLEAMRVPETLLPQEFGLWQIQRVASPPGGLVKKRSLGRGNEGEELEPVGWPTYTILRKHTLASLHGENGEVVMEDSRRELAQHLPICFAASGQVLVTGLGLGCVVRGLLANPRVTRLDVVEQDPGIVERVWPSLTRLESFWSPLPVLNGSTVYKPRAFVHQLEASFFAKQAVHLGERWDFAWHDLFLDAEESESPSSLTLLHLKLIHQLRGNVGRQGAWGIQRKVRRRLRNMGLDLIGLGAAR